MIRSLELVDWGPFEKERLVFNQPVALFTGPNGVGKSFIRDALVFAITGTLRSRRGVTKKKQVADVAVRDGAKRAQVEVLFESGLRIIRQIGASGTQVLEVREVEARPLHVTGQTKPVDVALGSEERTITGTTGELQAEIYRRLNLDEGRALAALESGYFLTLDPDRRKELLFQALGSGVTSEAVLKRLAERGIDSPDGRRTAMIAAEQGFRKAESHAVELRRAAKRKLDGLAFDGTPQHVESGGARRNLAEISEESIAEAIQALIVEHDQAVAAAGQQIGSARQVLEGLRAREAEIQAELGKSHPDPAGLQGEAEALQSLLDAAKGLLQTTRDELQAEAAVAALGAEISKPEVCPAIPGEFSCPVTPKRLESHRKSLGERVEAASAAVPELRQKVEDIEAEIADLEPKLASLGLAIEEAEDANANAINLERELEELQPKIEEAGRVAEELESAGEENPSAAQVETLKRRVEDGRTVLDAKRAWDAAVVANAEIEKSRTEAEAEIEAADALATAFGRSGVEAELLAEAIGPLLERLEETSIALGTVTLSGDLTLSIEVDGTRRSEAQLSHGQHFALGVIAQDAISSLSGLPIFVIDGADALVQDLRARTIAVAQRLVGRPYGSVWILAATEKTEPEAVPVGTVETFWLGRPGSVAKVPAA